MPNQPVHLLLFFLAQFGLGLFSFSFWFVRSLATVSTIILGSRSLVLVLTLITRWLPIGTVRFSSDPARGDISR